MRILKTGTYFPPHALDDFVGLPEPGYVLLVQRRPMLSNESLRRRVSMVHSRCQGKATYLQLFRLHVLQGVDLRNGRRQRGGPNDKLTRR